MAERQKAWKKKLIVTDFDVVVSLNDGKTTIYALTALDDQGKAIEEKYKLRSFWKPGDEELNTVVEYEINPYHHQKYGLTYTVQRPKDHKGSSGGQANARMDEMEQELRRLATRMEEVERQLGVKADEGFKSAAQETRQSQTTEARDFGEDPPF